MLRCFQKIAKFKKKNVLVEFFLNIFYLSPNMKGP